jgi:mannose-6-phosphate isomerase class I
MLLGERVSRKFGGRLPYLFKVLDARVPLSLQVHPTKAQAEAGFSRENAAGIPLAGPERSYRDDNHKPEVHCALTDFWMLHGFRPLEEIAGAMSSVPELGTVMPGFAGRLAAAGSAPGARRVLLRDLYAALMGMPQAEADRLLERLLRRLERQGPRDSDTHDFWALEASREFPLPGGHRDRGILSIYLLNLVHLAPGQGTFQPAGTLHAYLRGANVELMASSDNVLRGGLTPKHIDVPELLRTLSFHSGPPRVIEGRRVSPAVTVYPAPAEEFLLRRLSPAPGQPCEWGPRHSADCLIVMEGSAVVISEGRSLRLARGGIALVPAGVAYSVRAEKTPAVLFAAGVPETERPSEGGMQ